MSNSTLTWQIEGSGYNQTLSVYSNNQKIFNNPSYMFSIDSGENLQLMLNWGTNQFLPHYVRASGEFLILVPTLWSTSRSVILNEDAYIPFSRYLELTDGRSLIFPKQDLADLWNQLGYLDAGFGELASISSSELLMMWTLNSKYNPDLPEVFGLVPYVRSLCSQIVAQYPDKTPSAKEVILNILDQGLSSFQEITNTSSQRQFVIVYIEYLDKVLEWSAMLVDDKPICVLSDGYSVQLNSVAYP